MYSITIALKVIIIIVIKFILKIFKKKTKTHLHGFM